MTIKSWWPLVIFVLLASAPVSYITVEYSKPHDRAQPAKRQNWDAQRGKSIAEVGPKGDHVEGKQEAEWRSHFDKPTDWILAIFTGFLVLYTRRLYQATAGLFVETKGLREAADSQKEDMAKSLAISRDAAKAADESNKLTRDLFIAENRPWLILELNGWSDLIWEDRGARFSIEFTIINAGKYPATNVWFEAVAFPSWKASPASVETLREYCIARSTSRDAITDNGAIVVPGSPYRTGSSLLIFRDEIDKNIIMGDDGFSPAIKICVAYRSSIDKSTKYTGYVYFGVDISEGFPKILRISKGNLTNGQFIVTHFPGCDIST